jgi:hypothetical protein
MKSVREFAKSLGFSTPPIYVSQLARKLGFSKPFCVIYLMGVTYFADSMTQLLSSGSTGTKIDLVIMGDGFAKDDQTTYNEWVYDFLFNGLFSHDFFSERKQAFNVYRINLISEDSGVGTKKYDNGNLLNTVEKDTALGMYYNGSWKHCWIESGTQSGTLINNALDKWVLDRDLVIVVLNASGFGGCGGGGMAYITVLVDWSVLAHELGHAFGGLGDEYCNLDESWSGGEPSEVNLTTNSSRETLKWKSHVDPSTPIPTGRWNTGMVGCTGYNQGTKPSNWDDSQSVGLFEGGGHVYRGIYRPVINCRMRGNVPPFCPICYDEMKRLTEDYMPGNDPMPSNEPSSDSNGYVRLTIHVERGNLSIKDIKEVSGQLIIPTALGPGHAYEILIDDTPIAFGALPDLGVRRSFANPDIPGREGTHHITTLPSYDFFARIPKNQITRDTLPKLTIILLKVQQAPDRLKKSVSLTKQAGFRSIEVGRLSRISIDTFPLEIRPKLEHILKYKPK